MRHLWILVVASLALAACGGGGGSATGKVVFARKGGIFSIGADGKNPQRILPENRSHPAYDPAWSPDGTTVAVSRDCGIWLVGSDANGLREVAKPKVGGCANEPAWSPDGSKLAFVRRATTSIRPGAIVVMRASGGAERAVSQHEVTGHSPYDAFPSWSPDGKKIAFARAKLWDGEPPTVWVMNADGTGQHSFPQPKERAITNMPSWSADGRKLAFGWLPTAVPGAVMHVYSSNADGTGWQDMTKNPGPIGSRYPSWSPDGKKIAFIGVGVWVMDADGTNQKQLTTDLDDFAPDYWQPR